MTDNLRLTLILLGVGLLLIVLAFIGLRVLFLTASLDTLASLLAGLAVVLPIAVGMAFCLGRLESRGAMTAMELTMKTAVAGYAPMAVASVKAASIMEKALGDRLRQQQAAAFLGMVGDTLPQLRPGSGEIVDGEVTM
jgi:hypothetical protein